MKEYQGFAISNFRTGFDEAVEPWLLPRDAYQVMVNAHLYRGVLERAPGYLPFAKMAYRGSNFFGPPDGVTKTFSKVLQDIVFPFPVLPVISQNITVYGTTTPYSAGEIFTYSGDIDATTLGLTSNLGGTGTLDLVTNTLTVTFNTAPADVGANPGSCILIEWDFFPVPAETAIMGIKQYYSNNGSQEVVIFNQNRVGTIQPITSQDLIDDYGFINYVRSIPVDWIDAAIFTGDGMTQTFTGIVNRHFFPRFAFNFYHYDSSGNLLDIISDNGFGALVGTNVSSGYVNYVGGQFSITFTVVPTSGDVFNAVYGLYYQQFNSSISDFFSVTNYQFNMFFTNNVDPIAYYDGSRIHWLNTNLTTHLITASNGYPNNLDISRCLHVTTNRERLLLLAPVVLQVDALNTVYWSVAGNPFSFTNNEFLPASTSQPIRTFSYINSDLVIRFANSERILRYTGDAFSPFRFDVTNIIWACDAPFSPINYDSWFSSVGRPAIVASDGVNVQRADNIIPDFTDPQRLALQIPVPYMNQGSIIQCYGERFDDFKEGWLCYNSQPESESEVTASDNVLAFNYLDETYAVYAFPFSCLGFGKIVNVPTWGTIETKWGDNYDTWDSYALQLNALVDLAGDQFGIIYELDSGNVCTAAGDSTTTLIPVLMNVITKNFNPFIEQGELARLGYVDLFVSANIQSTLRVQFYVNDQLYIDSSGNPAGFYQETILTFTPTDAMSPTTNQTKVWKRIYVGSVGKEHTIRFYQNILDFSETNDQPIYIHAMVLYMKPAGRIFQ